MDNAATFTEKFYDWDAGEVKDYIKKNSVNGCVKIRFNYRQIGRSEEWFWDQVAELDEDWAKIRREILLEWSRASDNSPYAQEDISALIDMAKTKLPIREIFIKKYYKLNLYEEISPMVPILIGVDVSSGIGKDSSTVVLVNSNNKHIVGILANNKMDTDDLADVLMELVRKVVPNSILCIERNNEGHSVINRLRKQVDIEPKLYRELNKDDLKQKYKNGVVEATQATAASYGIWDDSVKRAEMHDKLSRFVKYYKPRICAEEFVSQLKSLVYDPKKGRVDHLPDEHDDIVMGYLMAIWVYYYGNNVPAFGIFRREDPPPGVTEEEELQDMYRKLKEEKEEKENDDGLYEETFQDRLLRIQHGDDRTQSQINGSMYQYLKQEEMEYNEIIGNQRVINPNGDGVISSVLPSANVSINPYSTASSYDEEIDFSKMI